MTLHTYSLPPDSKSLEDCERLINHDDCLLLLGDGVYAAVIGCESLSILKTMDCKIYVLKEDCDLAGIGHKITPEVIVADYRQFVALSEEHEKHLPWD